MRFYDVAKVALIVPAARLAQHELATATVRDLRRTLRRERRRLAVAGGASAVALAVGGPVLLLLFYANGEFSVDDATRVVPVVLIYSVALLPYSLATLLPRVLIAIDRASLYTVSLAGFLVLNVVLDALLVQLLGVAGLAVATILALAALAVVQTRMVDASLPRVDVGPQLEHE
jgi:peptidoglycan biosynthesis protein MviN/MurJ (putative lipid II flippase)